MDLDILKEVFPAEKFFIEVSESESVDDRPVSVDIKTKGTPENEFCAIINIDGKNLEVDVLHKCGIAGGEILKKIEVFARRQGCKTISLEDKSKITICDTEFDLAILKILTKGESWYNSLGYVSEDYNNEIKQNKKLINTTLDDENLGWIKTKIEYLYPREHSFEHTSLQSVSQKLLSLAMNCDNKEERDILWKICDLLGRNYIDYYRTLEKELTELPSPPPSPDKAKRTSHILSKTTKRGGRKRTNKRKKYLKRKTHRK